MFRRRASGADRTAATDGRPGRHRGPAGAGAPGAAVAAPGSAAPGSAVAAPGSTGARGAVGAPAAPGEFAAAPGEFAALGSPGVALPGVNVSVPHPARVWNYWLGGRDFFPADRAAGDHLHREFPHLAEIARAERAFLVRAVRYLAGPARIRQFLDIGAGLPAGGNTHEIAQRVAPDTGIVYADNDPVVLAHARALLDSPALASSPEGIVSYIGADLRNVTAVLSGSARTLDHGKPVALMMLGVLGHLDDHGAARSITSHLMDALPPGSYLAIADGVAGSEQVASAQDRYNQRAPVPYHLRRPDQIASFFDGLDLVEPGVVPCPRWKPDSRGADEPPASGTAFCGVARKP